MITSMLDKDDPAAYALAATNGLLSNEELNPFSYDVSYEGQLKALADIQELAIDMMRKVKDQVDQRCLTEQEIQYVTNVVRIVLRLYNDPSDY
jgi:hypothetical protein